MKFSPESVRAALEGAPKIQGRPTQGTLWTLKRHLCDGLRKLSHPDHDLEGFAPYLRTADEQALILTTPWTDPPNPGPHFEPPLTAVTDRLISIANSKWDVKRSSMTPSNMSNSC
jgi:hypothetical protein